jgi:hypothetical protein
VLDESDSEFRRGGRGTTASQTCCEGRQLGEVEGESERQRWTTARWMQDLASLMETGERRWRAAAGAVACHASPRSRRRESWRGGSWEPERLMAHDGCTDAAKADVRRLEAWEADGRRRTVAVRVQLGVADRPSGLGR